MIGIVLPLLLTPAFQSAPASRPGEASASQPAVRLLADLGTLPKPKPGTLRLLVVRHGESVGNATKDDPKLTDEQKDHLSDRGKAEAAETGAALRDAGVTRILHSTKARAKETAEIMRKAFGAKPPETTAAPDFTGMTIGKSPDETLRSGQYLGSHWARGEDPKLEGGESLADVAARCRKGADKLAHDTHLGAGPVALVTHGEVVAAWLAAFDPKATVTMITRVKIPNASVTAFDVSPNGPPVFLGVFVRDESAASRPK